MRRVNIAWLLLGVLCLAPFAVAQNTEWQTHVNAGTEAYQRGQYVEAEKRFLAALEEAEKFGEQDPRLASSLNSLADIYQAKGQHSDAEPLYLRSMAILKKTLGSGHPNVVAGPTNLA